MLHEYSLAIVAIMEIEGRRFTTDKRILSAKMPIYKTLGFVLWDLNHGLTRIFTDFTDKEGE